jgi:hypothetical protein
MKDSKLLETALVKIIKETTNFTACDFCKHFKKCMSKSCSEYVSGIGDAEGKYPNFKWSCEDFAFGTCPVLEKTPCYNCIQQDFKNFELDYDKLNTYCMKRK